MSHSQPSQRPICNYEGSGYRDDFWISQGREYEDLAERIALRRLLPARGRRLLEIGAGFGRLADLYAGYDEVVLLDYSRSLLAQARAVLGDDPRFTFVAADLYDLPLGDHHFDAVVMVRVLHHLVDVPLALQQARRVLAPDGRFVLEFANKRNVKAIGRYLLRRQCWSPFDRNPYEFVTLNFDFHPAWVRERLHEAGLASERTLTLSHFRWGVLKRAVPLALLARLDGLIQPTGALWQYSPSVMLRLRALHAPAAAPAGPIFRCPVCSGRSLAPSAAGLCCPDCGRLWPVTEGIYDFRPARGDSSSAC